jgi:hypothetical protein
MKSRKVGVNNISKRNATKRKRDSKILKSKKKKLNKRKRRTRRRCRRQRGGNADFVVVVIGTHGCHRTISDGVMDQERVPSGMDIRKINAAPLGLVNMTTYNDNNYDADTELVESTVQEVLNDCKDNCDLSSASYDLASKLKQTDRYTQDRDNLEDNIKDTDIEKRNLNRASDIYMEAAYGPDKDYEEIQNDISRRNKLYKNFMNKTDQRFQIEIINQDHPTYYDKSYSKAGDNDIMLFEENKKVANITHDVVGRLTRGWNIYTSEIYDYLASIGKYNVIIVDLSCSVLDYKEGFTDRDIRHLNYDMKQKRKLLPNPYKKEWQIKRKRGEFNRDDLDSHLNESMV